MEDIDIINLYLKRDESAIAETSKKYGGLCLCIAKNVLTAAQDAEECVNDTYLTAWNSIPPHKPIKLGAWLGRVVRNIAINLWNKNHCQKRYSGMDAILSELEECIPSPKTVESELDGEELTRFIDDWLDSLEPSDKMTFVKRYWYGESVKSIGKELNINPARIADKMLRLRKNLKAKLEKEGYSI